MSGAYGRRIWPRRKAIDFEAAVADPSERYVESVRTWFYTKCNNFCYSSQYMSFDLQNSGF